MLCFLRRWINEAPVATHVYRLKHALQYQVKNHPPQQAAVYHTINQNINGHFIR
jgi:hypothetical protein